MGRKGAPFSTRLSHELDHFVASEALRTKRSKGQVLEALADEARKARLVPGVAFRGDDFNRRAWVIGTALDVWQVIEAYHDFDEAVDRIIAGTDLTEHTLRVALTYYRRFPQEVDQLIALDRRPLEELREESPHFDLIAVEPD